MQNEIERYINDLPPERQERFRNIIEIVKRRAPQAERLIKYKMPTFQHGDAWLSVANKKNYISIYTCSRDKVAAFKRKHPQIKGGDTCINIKDSDDFELDDLTVITQAVFQ